MSATDAWIRDYVARQQAALASVHTCEIRSLIRLVRQTWLDEQLVVAIGNGGSAANASHFAVDLGKTASGALQLPVRVLALTDSVPWITAVGNDCSYDDVFVRQLQNVARPGDLLISLSVSGNSPNILKAVEWAKEHGVRTAALVGGGRGRLAEIAETVIAVGDSHFGRVEDVHMHVLHMVCYAFAECDEVQSGTAAVARMANADSIRQDQ